MPYLDLEGEQVNWFQAMASLELLAASTGARVVPLEPRQEHAEFSSDLFGKCIAHLYVLIM